MNATQLVQSKTAVGVDQLCINTIRTLSMDAVQQAKSGHPGTPMALAPLIYTIWNRVMRFDPQDPIWPNRDRFVLSNGHASMLLWSVLHLAGVQAVNADYERLGQPSVTLEDIRRFRQLDSKAPGHPEYHWVSGVETTTGPLGQGVATSVGMAIAEKWLANRYNRPGFELFDYRIYAVCGDGCLMEGVSAEAASLAGHLGLDNLCWVYDNNHITIEGNTRITFTEDVATRFLGYGWNVLRVGDANDTERILRALEDRSRYAAASGVARGAYVLADAPGGHPEVILIATGSELSLAVEAHETLLAAGIRSRVVSMPSWDVFDHQAAGVPGQRAATQREGPRRSGAGLDPWLGAIRRRPRPRHRDADVRGVGPAEGVAAEIRVRAGSRGGDREGGARKEVGSSARPIYLSQRALEFIYLAMVAFVVTSLLLAATPWIRGAATPAFTAGPNSPDHFPVERCWLWIAHSSSSSAMVMWCCLCGWFWNREACPFPRCRSCWRPVPWPGPARCTWPSSSGSPLSRRS